MSGEMCGHEVVTDSGRWVCVAPPHDAQVLSGSAREPTREVPAHYYRRLTHEGPRVSLYPSWPTDRQNRADAEETP